MTNYKARKLINEVRFPEEPQIMDTTCPLLYDVVGYTPDTIDLLNDAKERNYWLPCLEQMVLKFVAKAGFLNPDRPDAEERAETCFHVFHDLIERLKIEPELLKPLSIRTLLEFNEQTLRDNNFEDAWLLQKEKETEAAFLDFPKRIEFIDSIDDFEGKWLELSKGVLAGNMFDWGARAVTDILEVTDDFNLVDALNTIEERPWFKDDLNQWIKRLQETPYKSVVIFVDNAGVDFVLGILPLARQFLKQNLQVVLSANTLPALNDITFRELNQCLEEAAKFCPVIKSAILTEQLLGFENGQSGPCLDLRKLNPELCNAMKSIDLIILEGMGRAVHTNLQAKFKVDSLKLAVLKNEWLANSLGAQQFSVIFEFQPASSPL